MATRPFLFDVTRLVLRGLTGRRATGIDRVCQAYLARFAARSQAAFQLAGRFRVLDPKRSEMLFDVLSGPDRSIRRGIAALTPRALAGSCSHPREGMTYLNVGHTDFDLPAHHRWLDRGKVQAVYLIHDLIPITQPDLCRERAVRRHSGRVNAAVRSAAGIIVGSRTIEQELDRYARENRLPKPPTIAAPLAGAPFVATRSAFEQLVVGSQPYFICLGTIERRKNHVLLLDVWSRLVETMGDAAPRLVIAGQWGARSDEVRRLLRDRVELANHVRVEADCDDETVARLIAGARAMLLPSRAEGFGLPMVEALRMGTPVIASDLPSFREIGQGVPWLIDPLDRQGWYDAIVRFTADGPERGRQLARIGRFRAPTWDDHFSRVEPWLDRLAASASFAQAASTGVPFPA